MIRALLHFGLCRFERGYAYDAGFMHRVIDVSPGAARRYLGLARFTGFAGPNRALHAGAALASVLDGDCGPCAQLVLDMATQAGVPAASLKACLERDFSTAGEAGLGFRFAEAAIAGSPELDALRDEILERHGELALIAASYGAAGTRVYPVLKRGLGHGAACQRLDVAGEIVPVIREVA